VLEASRLSISASYARTWKHVPSCSIGLCKIDHPVGKMGTGLAGSLPEPGWPPRRHQVHRFVSGPGGNSGSGSRSQRSPLGGIWRASRRERWDGGKGSYGRIEGHDGAPRPDGDGGSGGVKAGVKTARSKSETRFAAPEPFSDDRVDVVAQGGGPYVHLHHVDFNLHNHDIVGHLFLRCHHHDGAKVRNAGVGTRPAESADHASRCQCSRVTMPVLMWS
jgi:hypothetical protein